ncbi:hypothetical protein BGZ83_001660 [Gryganskiella cystojenkinii]|nr:hypothetical protein BGZ83_001660 [Gryganskiella cystojenkinii]
MKSKACLIFVPILLATITTVAQAVVGSSQAVKCPSTIPIYRLYSSGGTDHFYTTSAAERDNASNNLGYTQEGIAGYVYPSEAAPCQSTVPIYRMYNGAIVDHFYTADPEEAQNAIKHLGYNDEGKAWYMFPNHVNGTVPLYRMYNSNIRDHFYTANVPEKDNAVNRLGYTEEGVLGWLYNV